MEKPSPSQSRQGDRFQTFRLPGSIPASMARMSKAHDDSARRDVAGPDPATYVFAKTDLQRNLFRIPLP